MEDVQNFRPPVLVGERVAWLGSGSGLPQPSTVRWIGRIPEITAGWTVGIELDRPMPVGGIDGTWGKRKLFSCEPKRGLLVPVDTVMKESSFLKTRHSLGEKFYEEGPKKILQNKDLLRKLSLPQSTTSQEFISSILPQSEVKKRIIPETGLNFKTAAYQLQKSASNENSKLSESNKSSKNDLTHEQLVRQQTIEELEKFKKHLDDLEKLKNSEYRIKSRKKKIGDNPESIYNLAKSKPDNSDEALFLRIIGEKKNLIDDVVKHKDDKKESSRRKEVINSVISEESEEISIENITDNPVQLRPKEKIEIKNDFFGKLEKNPKKEIVNDVISKESVKEEIFDLVEIKSIKPLEIKEAKFFSTDDLFDAASELLNDILETDFANERIEENLCNEIADFLNVDVEIDETSDILTDESVNQPQPTPTIRKKRKEGVPDPPVPSPRRRSNDGRQDHQSFPDETDTTSVLYEPAFLRSYLETETDQGMTDVRGTFRRIDEDELDRRNQTSPTSQTYFSASVSAPGGTKKGLFSFFRWFKKSKPNTDLDLEAFDAPSVTASPLFPRHRLANAGSIDTLYSIATVSSFAFVSGAQYLNGTERRKKRRAPAPPPKRRDSSLPNTLENRSKQQHRRSISESYKDRRSGAFAHVQGKRKAPQPPVAPPRERLYPSLSSVRDGTKKRPAPQPPERPPNNISPTARIETITPEVAEEPTPLRDVVCNDTLKLERGVLRANKVAPLPVVSPDVTKIMPSSPVSPRPWYKRKSLEKRKEKSSSEWMPEIGIARTPSSPDSSPLKFPFFSRSDEKKKDDKRKSGLSILANISELDREAAEICRKEQAHQQQILDDDDAQFYSDINANAPSRNSTKELITLFNTISNLSKTSVSSSSKVRDTKEQHEIDEDFEELAVANCDKRDVKIAGVVETTELISNKNMADTNEVSRSQALFDMRSRRHHSPSPSSISTIAEISEPSSSAATLNQYSELVWKCSRCTLENQNWKNRCDACSNCKPNYSPSKKTVLDKRKSEMELEIDWEKEIQKYFPVKKTILKEEELSAKLTLSKTGDVLIKTETNQGTDLKEEDLDDLRRKRLAFFMKSLGTDASTSLRDAAAKKSLDETERSKIKGMLKEMKNSLPKYDGVINKTGVGKSNAGRDRLPDVTLIKNLSSEVNVTPTKNKIVDVAKYGAINKVKTTEAMLVTTKTIHEDILVRKKSLSNENELSSDKNSKHNCALKKARRVGDGPFELMKPKDLVNIIESKTNSRNLNHLYANYPVKEESDVSSISDESSGSEVARLASQLTQPAGVAQFKASLDLGTSDTLAINRLLRRLEAAIAEGRHDQAATLARELAALKVNCSVIRQKPSPSPPPPTITLDMYVEDKISHQGPIPVKVQKTMTLADLKIKIQADFQIPTHVQRWIVGKELATEDHKTLENLGAAADNCPIFLYLVAPEPEAVVQPETPTAPEKSLEDSEEGAVGLAEPPKAKGWYFNFEEDRYSFCESESEDEKEATGKEAAVKVIQRTIENAQRKSSSPVAKKKTETEEKEEKSVLQPAPQAKLFSGKDRPPLKASVSLPEKSPPKEDKQNDQQDTKKTENDFDVKPKQSSSNGKSSSAVNRPRSRSIFDLIKPQANETLKKDLKVISVNAVKETIEKLNRRVENIERDGWKCSECTLINAAVRPGCAACTAPRPPGYAPSSSSEKPIEQELKRLRRDQSFDFPVQVGSESTGSENQHYLQLVNLDSAGLVINTEEFECTVCFTNQTPGEGVVLRECLHTFCRPCLVQTVEYNEEAEVKCPYRDNNYSCNSVLQQREIKALVSQRIFEQHLARSVSQAENQIGNAFHCKSPDCKGWCIIEDNANEFKCPVCKHVNCLPCRAIHEGITCRTYQQKLRDSNETNAETKRTRSMLEEMVQRGDAMSCPTCEAFLMKKWGCDWLKCSMCKTEICWVTRGPRWGPGGKGDASAGCQCGLNGVKCHPKCNYCH